MRAGMTKYRLNNKGFTLIELMVTVLLIGLVLTTVYGMVTAGNRFFAQGDAKADIQSSLRVSANYISDQIRYASDVQILGSLPSAADMAASGKHYIYEESGVLKYYDGHSVQNIPGLLEGVNATLHLEDENSQTVSIRIDGTARNQTYNVETAAFLLNIGTSALAAGSGPAIEFSPGAPVIADVNSNPITGITIKTDPEGILESPIDGQVIFKADVTPADASRKTVEWHFISPVSYATVASTSATTGLLEFDGSEAGDAVTVYASALDGTGVTSNHITITVTDSAIIPATSVTVASDYSNIFQKGGEMQMEAHVTPEDASLSGVTWSLNVGSSIATISSDGMLRTNTLNSSTGTIVVTATLASGESDTKNIQIIENITGAQIQEVSSSNSGGTYSGKIKCTLLPGNISATPANGAASVTWDVSDLKKCSITSMTPNSDGTLDLVMTQDKSNASFSIRATVTPISGTGKVSNLIQVNIN